MTEPTLRERAEQIAEAFEFALPVEERQRLADAIEAFGRAVSDAATATMQAAVTQSAREIRRLERAIELERHALNNRPLCPDCRDKTSAGDECLRCRYQRAEARADAATAAERQRRAEIVRKLSNYNTYERVAEAIEREP